MRIPLVAIAPIVFAAAAARGADGMPDLNEQELQKAGIKTDRAGVVDFLKSLSPDSERARIAAKLLKDLGSPDYRTREAATRKLRAMNNVSIASIKAATESPDPEVRWRARKLLKAHQSANRLHREMSVLQVLARKKYPGLTPLLLPLLPRWTGLYEVDVTRAALLATTTSKELPALRVAIQGDGPAAVRSAAVFVLASKAGKEVSDELLPLLKDRHESVRYEAALGLARNGRRECLKTLVDLLSSKDRYLRSRASQLLRGVTKQRFGYVAYDTEQRRKTATQKWTAWLARDGGTVKLSRDLRTTRPVIGRILYCDYGTRRLIEFDRNGKQTFSAGGFSYIWGAYASPNGRRVAVDYSRRFVVEYDAAGKEAWRYERLPGSPSSVEKLPNGNLLLALTDSGLVIEVSPEKKIVWKVKLQGRPTTAQRLENGVTVVNLQFAKKVVDIDRGGKILHELKGISNALTAQRLSNGNTLVCEMSQHRVRELDPRGRVVWSKDGFRTPARAQRLPNGNTLVSDALGLHEIAPSKKTVWKKRISRGMFFHY